MAVLYKLNHFIYRTLSTIPSWIMILILTNASAQSFDIYVSDAGNLNQPPWQILKYDESGQNPEVFIDENLNWPQDILFLEDSNLVLISNVGIGRINAYDANTGDFISVFANGIADPTRMKIGPDGLIYVLQWAGNGKVRRYELDGTYVGEFTSTGVNASIGMDWDKHGNLYISSYYDHLVRRYDTAGNDLGLFIDTIISGPTNIWFDDNGDLLVLNYDGYSVMRFDSAGIYKGDFITGLNKSEGVAIYPNGDILIGNGGTSAVKLYDKDGIYKSDLIPSSSGNLLQPNAVVLRENPFVGITKEQTTMSLSIYPNPSNGIFTISGVFQKATIYDAQGNQINNVLNDNIIDLTNHANGIYFVLVDERAFRLLKH